MAKPKTYISTAPAYIGGMFFQPGDVFITDAEALPEWTVVDKGEKAAIEAAKPGVPSDVDLTGMSADALSAYAATVNVNPKGLSKDELLKAIHAANEPKL